MRENRLLTISKFDVQIIKDTEGFVNEFMIPEEFDGSMMFAMKTILSYYEVKRDRIISDYLYILCMPLLVIKERKERGLFGIGIKNYFFNLFIFFFSSGFFSTFSGTLSTCTKFRLI